MRHTSTRTPGSQPGAPAVLAPSRGGCEPKKMLGYGPLLAMQPAARLTERVQRDSFRGKVRRGRPGWHHPHPQALLWSEPHCGSRGFWFAQDSTLTFQPMGSGARKAPWVMWDKMCHAGQWPGSSVPVRSFSAWHSAFLPAVHMLLGNENFKNLKICRH